jgi:hypothetical protein
MLYVQYGNPSGLQVYGCGAATDYKLYGPRVRRSDLTGRGTRGSSLSTVRTAILPKAPLALTRLTAIVVTVAVLELYTKGYALASAADKC